MPVQPMTTRDEPIPTPDCREAEGRDAPGTGDADSSGAGSPTSTPPRDEAVEQVKAAIAEKFAPAIDMRAPYAKVMLDMAARAALSTPYVTGLLERVAETERQFLALTERLHAENQAARDRVTTLEREREDAATALREAAFPFSEEHHTIGLGIRSTNEGWRQTERLLAEQMDRAKAAEARVARLEAALTEVEAGYRDRCNYCKGFKDWCMNVPPGGCIIPRLRKALEVAVSSSDTPTPTPNVAD